jgi:hypothetical protein
LYGIDSTEGLDRELERRDVSALDPGPEALPPRRIVSVITLENPSTQTAPSGHGIVEALSMT